MTTENGELHIKYALTKGSFTSNIDLTLPTKGITAIFGASGSGKTTLLRFLAGLENIPGGQITFNSNHWQNGSHIVPTHKRPIGYVFQEASLFSHLNIEQNLEYGLKRTPVCERTLDFEDVIALLGLNDLIDRYPNQLSGGQRQRVAIARALLAMPKLLLMDEPLAALDNNSKAEILPYLEKLHEELAIPIIYVSHSVHEVVRIADQLVLLENGAVLDYGPINSLMTNPELPLSTLEEACAVLEGTIEAHDDMYHLTHLKMPSGIFTVSRQPLPLGKTVRIRVLARDVSITRSRQTDTSISNILPVEILEFFATGDPAHTMVRLNAGGTHILARITYRSKALLKLETGQILYAQIKSVSLLRDLPS